MTEKYDTGSGLITGALTADWGDVENDTINSWTAGVARVLKKYLPDSSQIFDEEDSE